jgi:HK97 family phage major capsid protein
MTDSFIRRQQELKGNLTMQIRSVIDGAESHGRGLDAAEVDQINRIEADIESAQRSIEVAQQSEARAVEFAEVARNVETVDETAGSSAEIFRSLAEGSLRRHTFENRAALVPSANTVGTDFLDMVMMKARLVGPFLELAEVFQRSSGNDLRIPVLTGYSAATQKAAGAALDESNPVFGSINLQPAKQGFLVPVANELLTDASFPLESTIADQAGNAIGTRADTIIHTAVAAVAGTGVTAASETEFTADELIDLVFSVDGAVRNLPGTGFVVSTGTLSQIRKLKDGDNRYLLDYVAGGPSTVLGFPIFESPSMPATTESEKAVFFGHFPSVKVATTGLDVAVSPDYAFNQDVTTYRFLYRIAAAVANGADHVKSLTMAAA